tara:strand:+ start:835 stop:1185 length:351 start_codon:yes stop_codon:yes gene_type:complete
MQNKSFETRPWGEYHILNEQKDFKIKKIIINPGQRLSYQYHNKRSELWVVIKGKLSVIIDDKEYSLLENEHIKIPQGAKHRAQNLSENIVHFIEVQTGTYFGEDDIVRIEDDYNRE